MGGDGVPGGRDQVGGEVGDLGKAATTSSAIYSTTVTVSNISAAIV